MTEPSVAFEPRFTHLGLLVKDLDAMVSFYRDNFAMIVSDQGTGTSGREHARAGGAFMTADPSEHHQLVLIEGRPEEMLPTTTQISFNVEELGELRAFYRHAVDTGIPIEITKNHGTAWSLYIDDPDGNMVEVYCHAPWYAPQPLGEPLNLADSEADILSQTEQLVKSREGWMSRANWMAAIEEKMAANTVLLSTGSAV